MVEVAMFNLAVLLTIAAVVAGSEPYGKLLSAAKAALPPHVELLVERSIKASSGRVYTHRITLFANGSSWEDVTAWVAALNPPPGLTPWLLACSTIPSAAAYVGAAVEPRGFMYRVYVEREDGSVGLFGHPLHTGDAVSARAVALKWPPDDPGAAVADVYTAGDVRGLNFVVTQLRDVVQARGLSVSVANAMRAGLGGALRKLAWVRQPDKYALVKHKEAGGGRVPVQVSVGFPSIAAPVAHVGEELDTLARLAGVDPGQFEAAWSPYGMHRLTHIQAGVAGRPPSPMVTVYFREYQAVGEVL